MSWNKDSLVSKARVMFEKASKEDKDDIFFGLFNSIGLELLERAALSKISPTLLAENDNLQRHILFALGHESGSTSPKSIITARVIEMCSKLVPEFEEMKKFAISMANRRNEEAHSGAMAFKEYTSDSWIVSFYKTTKILADFLEISMENLMGEEVSKEADEMLKEDSDKIRKEVNDKIAKRKSVFREDHPEGISEEERKTNDNKVDSKTSIGYHKVKCPVCGEDAVITGVLTGKTQITHEDETIIERSNVTAKQFECEVCKLKLNSFAELQAASLPLHFTRIRKFLPEEYYGWEETAFSDNLENDISAFWEYNNE